MKVVFDMTNPKTEINYADIVTPDEILDAHRQLAHMLEALTTVEEPPSVRPEIVCVAQGWSALQIGRSVANIPLYLAGRQYPMVNTLSFDGDMSKSWSADALQLHLQAVTGAPPAAAGADVNDIRLWYSTKDRQAGCCVILGCDSKLAHLNPEGVQGAYQRREDGKGYAFTYRLPWAALHSTRAPRPGERLTACIQCHWGTEHGDDLLCGGVEVRADNASEVYVPESWGWAVFE
jgi:hypothetical protein